MFTNSPDLNPAPVTGISDAIIQKTLDSKTKPPGSLGELEQLAFRLARIKGTHQPVVDAPGVIIFAADHGVTKNQQVSAFPREVTGQMVMNILSGGAACSVLARQYQANLMVVNAGVDADLTDHPHLLHRSFGRGTADMSVQPAILPEQLTHLLEAGSDALDEFQNHHPLDLFIPGEMGIGNTSSAALLTHFLCDIPLHELTGNGTGVFGEQLSRKLLILEKVADLHRDKPIQDRVAAVGGFEIIMMAGAMLRSASLKIPFVVDGFICTAALLVARLQCPYITDYAIFAHKSGEQGHQLQLEFLDEKPLLDMNMRLGEASGALTALPIIISAGKILTEMAEFESAGVTNSADDA